MLYVFLEANRDELVARCRAKAAVRRAPEPTPQEIEFGIPLFIVQLVNALRVEELGERDVAGDSFSDIGTSAGKHGSELLRRGFTVDQVVHDYGDLCQALTELAHEKKSPITVDEFHTFNRCLDSAMADAVTGFGRDRDKLISEQGDRTMNERLGAIAHELRNHLNTATLAYHAVRTGSVTLAGATGAVLGRSLDAMRTLVDRSLADVRLIAGLEAQREPISLDEFFDEVELAAALEAKDRGLAFTVSVVPGLVVDADRQMLFSAVANLVQNAFKFTHVASHVVLRGRADGDRVLIEVEDECGGLPAGATEALFAPFEQRSANRTGLGLGLSISRRGVEANGGTLRVRDLPGRGCVFTIDLPRATR